MVFTIASWGWSIFVQSHSPKMKSLVRCLKLLIADSWNSASVIGLLIPNVECFPSFATSITEIKANMIRKRVKLARCYVILENSKVNNYVVVHFFYLCSYIEQRKPVFDTNASDATTIVLSRWHFHQLANTPATMRRVQCRFYQLILLFHKWEFFNQNFFTPPATMHRSQCNQLLHKWVFFQREVTNSRQLCIDPNATSYPSSSSFRLHSEVNEACEETGPNWDVEREPAHIINGLKNWFNSRLLNSEFCFFCSISRSRSLADPFIYSYHVQIVKYFIPIPAWWRRTKETCHTKYADLFSKWHLHLMVSTTWKC